jgi:hypothetical protein
MVRARHGLRVRDYADPPTHVSRILIQQYLNQLRDLRAVSGTHRESVVREAFKDLLKDSARSHDLIFVPEYEVESPAKERRYVDGALLYSLRVPFGYWEAKEVPANEILGGRWLRATARQHNPGAAKVFKELQQG